MKNTMTPGKEENTMEPNPHLKAAVMEVVENQLRDGDPPETKEKFARLLAEGHGEDEARRLLGCVVVSEIFDIMKSSKPFDATRYAQALSRLPEVPGD